MKRSSLALAGGALFIATSAAAAPPAGEAVDADAPSFVTDAPAAKAAPAAAARVVHAPRPVAKITAPAPQAAVVASAAAPAAAAPTVVAAVPVVAPAAAPPAPAPAAAAPSAPAKANDWLRKEKPVAARSLETKNGPSPLRVGGMLALVATLGGVAFYARRKKQLVKAAAPSSQLRVLGTTRVGPKASAVVVEVAGKRILLGVTEQAVSNLAWLDDDANAAVDDAREPTHLASRPASARPIEDVAIAGPSGFLRLLRNAVGSGAKAPLPVAVAVDEVVRTTRDEVRFSRRSEDEARLSRRGEDARSARQPRRDAEEELEVEGQVMGLTKRRRDLP